MLKAAGTWFADYGRVYADKNSNEFVCVGFSRGIDGTFNTLMNLKDHSSIEVEFIAMCLASEADLVATETMLTRGSY